MGRVEAARKRGWSGRTGDAVLDWFAEAEEERLAKAFHPLAQYPIHPACRCGKNSVQTADGEVWEVLEPLSGACPLCGRWRRPDCSR